MHTSMRVGDISFAGAIAFLFGVFAANSGWKLHELCAVGIVAGITIVFVFGSRKLWKYIALIILAIAAGALYYFVYAYWQTAHTHIPSAKSVAFFGVVQEEPKAAGHFTMLVIALSRPYAGTMDMFTTPNNTQFHYGDELWIKGSVSTSSDISEPAAMFFPQLRVIASHERFWLMEVMIDLKAAIVQKIVQAFPPDQAALLAGILLGSTSAMSAALKAQMEASGTTYIVNMYGYKIAIITGALATALKDHLPRRGLLVVTLFTIVLFVMASGGAISAVRAAVMGSFAVVARGTGRMFNARNAVTFAALGMVLLDATLLTDAGFQLSFLSFLGIYYLGPAINNYFHWTGNRAGGALQWKEHAMLSLATNLAILPIVMNTFGAFSLTSLISNILIMIPWVEVIACGALVALFGFFAPTLAFCVAQIASVLLQYELLVIRVFATIVLPMPSVFDSAFAITCYYGVLIIFTYYYATGSQKDN